METSFNFSTILDDVRKTYIADGLLNQCPDIQHLIDLVYGDLDDSTARETTRHLDVCTVCGIAMLKIEADYHQWNIEMATSADHTFAKALGPKGRRVVQRFMTTSSSRTSMASTVKQAVSTWVSRMWTPTWAGQVVTALDLPEEKHHFDMGDGEYVKLSCAWEGGQTRQTRRIRLSWTANIFSPGRIWVHFIDPETNEMLGRYCIGDKLEGVQQLESSDLNFDPSIQKWAIQIVIEP